MSSTQNQVQWELPCRSCHKANVPCVYPAVSHAEDKRNHLSKAALEAIEDRLKAIEDMLHTILQSQSFVAELPTAAVDQFLNTNKAPQASSSPPNAMTLPPQPYIHQDQQTNPSSSYAAFPSATSTTPLPHPPLSGHSPQHQYQKSSTSTATATSSPNVKLPSIHDLSSPPSSHKVKQEQPDTTDLPPPLGYPSYTGRIDIPSAIKKRKRSS
ncbi:unnamed protein product [Absidia cylindrospora]